jgi:hypothetical protein
MDNNGQIVTAEQDLPSLREQFDSAIFMADDIVTKNYLSSLSEMDVVPPNEKLFVENSKDAVRLIRIDEIVYSQDEYATHKFASVLGAMTTVENSVFLLVDSDGDETKFYMGVRCDDSRRDADTQLTILRNSLQGQFPGIKATKNTEYKNHDIIKLIQEIKPGSISSVSCVANLRDEYTRNNKGFLQGLEKFVLSLRGKPYTALILASSLPQERIADIRRMYEQIYTQLSPFAEQQFAYGTNESWNKLMSDAHGISVGTADTIGHISTKGRSIGTSKGKSDAVSKDNTASRLLGALSAAAGVVTTAIGVAATIASGGTVAPISAPMVAAGATAAAAGIAATLSKKSATTAINTNEIDTTTETEGDSIGHSDTETRADTHTTSEGQSSGTSQNLTLTVHNKSVLSLMERIDKQLERMCEFESYGMWECGAYFISPEPNVSEIAASTYKAIMSGEHTGIEISAVNSWWQEAPQTEMIYRYVTNFMQPLFRYDGAQGAIDVSAGTFVSGKELALHMGLPRKSVPGFPVVEHAEFAKEVIRNDGVDSNKGIVLGNIYTMGKVDDTMVALDRNSLTAHTFITGSTGAGKSNAIYCMLSKLCPDGDDKTHFLVIEPAKGEYKNVFGGRSDVAVYGTNPAKAPLLRLNPFEFPNDIHVLEHIDRLVEVFNACWPMYAAMPAILKEAVEAAYVRAGWNLNTSRGTGSFPTFETLIGELPRVIDESAYSKDTNSDYKGALVTRVKALTKGIHGQMFHGKQILDAELFDKNTIIDLSRIGSMETKALLMGIIVLKLQEYRMAKAKDSDRELRHITVLEEAHNLLRRTSVEQSQESSNLQGKSVGMLANAIAEMRTYGEGFVIADQSPGLLDMSVIRNTNTKIILRLPDESDRQLVGRAAGLNDDQIQELAKLKVGVAAVSQNNWLEPVLCQVEEFKDGNKTPYKHESKNYYPAVQKFFSFAMIKSDGNELSKEDVDNLDKWREDEFVDDYTDSIIGNIIKKIPLGKKEREALVYNIFDGKRRAVYLQGEPNWQEIDCQIQAQYDLDKSLAIKIRNCLLEAIQNELREGEISKKIVEKLSEVAK